jgi:hypothetical protein
MSEYSQQKQRLLVAYTVGSLWYCVGDGEKLRNSGIEVEPVFEGDMHREYTYHCEVCRRRLPSWVETIIQDSVWVPLKPHAASIWGRTVLVRTLEDDTVEFYPRGGREVPKTMAVADFVRFFRLCHEPYKQCKYCHSAPGKLKD